MATRAAQRVLLPGVDGSSVALYKWEGLLDGDVGEAVAMNGFSDKNYQVYGTAGSGLAATLEGDNSEAADKWYSLAKSDGTVLSLTAVPSGAQVLDHTFRVRPAVSGDGSTDVTALLYTVAKG